jgi:hypothetical protein
MLMTVPIGLLGGRPVDVPLTVTRLANAVEQKFDGLIDVSDLQRDPPEEIRKHRLSRALAAYAITCLTGCEPKEAALSITDGWGDQGIDAIFFDAGDKALYLVQSKWSDNGRSTIDQGEMEKFLRGVQSLTRPDFSQFNEKIRARQKELTDNLLKRSDVRVVLVITYSSPSDMAAEVAGPLSEYVREQNNVGDSEVFSREVCNLKRLYGYLSGQDSAQIKIDIALRWWGRLEAPYNAYYGQVLVQDIATWAIHGRPLFAKNLRYFRGETPINEGIERTLIDNPKNFWYFNNGITMLSNKVGKALMNTSNTDIGIFNCEGVSIVNGAQTVGVTWEIAKRDPTNLALQDARVQMRIISLEECPDGFGTDVTRAANTQNPIRQRDYAALDPEQHRLAAEMSLDNRRYAYKSGDIDPRGVDGCNIDEATVALACANDDVAMAVQAKREVGLLWQDIQKPPYTTLFNSQLTAQTMWRAVLVLRAVEDQLKSIDTKSSPRGELVAVHGNRFILHRIFRTSKIQEMYRNPRIPEGELVSTTNGLVEGIFRETANLVQSLHSGAYLANLFKNAQKNKGLETALDAPPGTSPGQTMPLDFGN